MVTQALCSSLMRLALEIQVVLVCTGGLAPGASLSKVECLIASVRQVSQFPDRTTQLLAFIPPSCALDFII